MRWCGGAGLVVVAEQLLLDRGDELVLHRSRIDGVVGAAEDEDADRCAPGQVPAAAAEMRVQFAQRGSL